jgi:hypothetical protein
MSQPTTDDGQSIFSLPPEMRNRIYFELLQQAGPIRITWAKKRGKPHLPWRYCRVENPLAITKTCKVIRAECHKLFYASKKFVLRCGEGDDKTAMLDRFFSTIGAEQQSLKPNIVLNLGHYSDEGLNTVEELPRSIGCLLYYKAAHHVLPLIRLAATGPGGWWSTFGRILPLDSNTIQSKADAFVKMIDAFVDLDHSHLDLEATERTLRIKVDLARISGTASDCSRMIWFYNKTYIVLHNISRLGHIGFGIGTRARVEPEAMSFLRTGNTNAALELVKEVLDVQLNATAARNSGKANAVGASKAL